MKSVIVDFGAGNLHSAEKAFMRAAKRAGEGDVIVSDQIDVIKTADRLILPGDGAFATAMKGLQTKEGLVQALEEHVFSRSRPLLGICVGMQILASESVEHGVSMGLGWIPGRVKEIPAKELKLPLPHMGWNELELLQKDHPLIAPLQAGDHAYFVHSYRVEVEDPYHLLAQAEYAGPTAAIIAKDGVAGAQFHPEKSHEAGERLIDAFLAWKP